MGIEQRKFIFDIQKAESEDCCDLVETKRVNEWWEFVMLQQMLYFWFL